MMNARLNKALVALLAVAAIGACDDPPIEPGSSDPARIFVNPGHTVLEAGAERQVQAFLVNDLGNPVSGDVSFEACDANVTVAADTTQTEIEPGSNFIVTAGNTLGESCVIVSGASFEDTIGIDIVPAELSLALPDTLLSGTNTASVLTFVNVSGSAAAGFDLDEVSFESLDTLVALIDAAGTVTAQAPGTVELVVTLDEGLGAERADTITAVVVPGDFSGTMSPTTAAPNDTVTFTAGAIAFDDDTRVFLGEEEAYIVSQTATTIEAVVPEDADGTFLLTNLGPAQVASVGTYTAADAGEISLILGATIPGKFSFDDAQDIFFVNVPVGMEYDVSIEFTEDSDVDAYMTQDFVLNVCADDAFGCSMATGDNPETVTATIPAGSYEIIVQLYDAHGNEVTDYVITFE